MPIGELARRAGVPTSTIRYYERRHLIVPDSWKSGQRRYNHEALRRLVFIGMLQDAGLSLDDVHGMLHAQDKAEWKSIATDRLVLLTEEIDRLERARSYVSGALLCRYDHPLVDCNVMRREIDRRIDRS